MLSVFCAPYRYVQGRDATLQLSDQLMFLGLMGPALIVTSKTAQKCLEAKWEETFNKHKMSYSVHCFKGECTQEEIEIIHRRALEEEVSVIIGAGGGKVLDTAKASAVAANVDCVICPTIAASDAPCSALSVIYTPKGAFETYQFFKHNPKLVLVDSTIIAQSPSRFLVAGMGDALATMFEALSCTASHSSHSRGGVALEAAIALSKLCYHTLLKDGVLALEAVRQKAVTPALERIIEANTLLSGLGFESCGLAAAHSIHNGLTEIPETHSFLHGEKVSFGTLCHLILEGRDSDTIEEVLEFMAQVGLPMTLKEIGISSISKELVEKVAKKSLIEGETIHNMPFPVDQKMLTDAILTANEVGTEFLKSYHQ